MFHIVFVANIFFNFKKMISARKLLSWVLKISFFNSFYFVNQHNNINQLAVNNV